MKSSQNEFSGDAKHQAEVAEVTLRKKAHQSDDDIAAALKCSSQKVQRLWKEARDFGIAEESEIVVHEGKLPAEAWGIARRRIRPFDSCKTLREIQDAKRRTLLHYHVVFAGPNNASIESRLVRFGQAAVSPLMPYLAGGKVIGVTWGETLLRTFSALPKHPLASGAVAFPTIGDPPEFADAPATSSKLVSMLMPGKALSLRGVFPVNHHELSSKREWIHQQNMAASSDYSQIFDQSGLLSRMETVLTSIGRLKQPWNMNNDDLVRILGIQRERLNELIAGDIGGVLIPHRNLSEKDRKEFDAIDSCWTGMKLKDVERVASNAAHGQGPGVIVVAMGKTKARFFVEEVVRRGLVNIAIVDNTFDDEVSQLLGGEVL